jgi:hypothetical protein
MELARPPLPPLQLQRLPHPLHPLQLPVLVQPRLLLLLLELAWLKLWARSVEGIPAQTAMLAVHWAPAPHQSLKVANLTYLGDDLGELQLQQ